MCSSGDRETKPLDPKPQSQRSIHVTPILHCPQVGGGPWEMWSEDDPGGNGGAEQGNPEPVTQQSWGGGERGRHPPHQTLQIICVAEILLGAGSSQLGLKLHVENNSGCLLTESTFKCIT